MEKRNFVTPIRTVEGSDIGDSLVSSASQLFSNEKTTKNTEIEKIAAELAQKASEEDEKTDSL